MINSIFWAAAGVITLIVAVILVRALRRGGENDLQPAIFDQQVYRDQLAEIERDQTRGVIAEDEAKRKGHSDRIPPLVVQDTTAANTTYPPSAPVGGQALQQVALMAGDQVVMMRNRFRHGRPRLPDCAHCRLPPGSGGRIFDGIQ